MGPVLGDKVAIHLPDKTHWPKNHLDKNSLYTVEATAYALMQKVVLGRHNETHAIAKWLLEKRELGGGFKSTQVTRASERGGWGRGASRGADKASPPEGAALGTDLTL